MNAASPSTARRPSPASLPPVADLAPPEPPAARPVSFRPGVEYYDAVLGRLVERPGTEHVGRLIGLAGCSRRAGVSTLAANLAIRAAEQHLGPVLLVDANVCSPRLARWLATTAAGGRGLVDVLASQAPLEAVVQATAVAGLDVLPLGERKSWEQAAFDVGWLDGLVGHLRETYRLVLVDLPEVDRLGQVAALAHRLDDALLVVRSERDRQRTAQRAVDRLLAVGVSVAGAILTQQHQYVPNWLDRWL